MNRTNIRILAGAAAAVVLAAALFSYDGLSANRTNAKDISSARSATHKSSAVAKVQAAPHASEVPSSEAPKPIRFTDKLTNSIVKNPDSLKKSLHSTNAVLIDVNGASVLMDKSAGQKIYPASMTKIMTAILTIENVTNLQEKVTVNKATIDEMNSLGASMAGFEAGEQVSVLDLLYGAILPSGAECCATLADHLAGSEESFAIVMNQKARSLGMSGTHFVNTSGLHDPNHYTTCRDLATLLCYALRNPTFRRVFTTPSYTTLPTNKHPNGVSFQSTMFRCLNSANVGKTTILGGKVGFTDEAGLCLASLAEYGGKEYILVTAGGRDCYRAEIQDALTVYGSLGK